jgi:hypothetical protein
LVLAGYAGLVLLVLRILKIVSDVSGDVAVMRWKVEELWRWYHREHDGDEGE